jgi:hypothetical protein
MNEILHNGFGGQIEASIDLLRRCISQGSFKTYIPVYFLVVSAVG